MTEEELAGLSQVAPAPATGDAVGAPDAADTAAATEETH